MTGLCCVTLWKALLILVVLFMEGDTASHSVKSGELMQTDLWFQHHFPSVTLKVAPDTVDAVIDTGHCECGGSNLG